jgi:Cap4-like dsDNA endonuclease family protein
VELRESGQDFRIIFDVFDDIMVVDSATNPTKAYFYQLTSKDPGNWTIREVCRKVGEEAPRSIVSRLYAHVVSFGGAVAETGLISNAAFIMQLLDGTKTTGARHRITGDELHDDEVQKLATAVSDDINNPDIPNWLPRLAFIQTTLGVHDQHLLVIGRLQAHLEQTDGVGPIKLTALYETLHASIVQRTTFYQEGIDHSEILLRKSLTRNEIEELLIRARARSRSFVEDWEIIRDDLTGSSIGSITQVRLKTAMLSYRMDRNSGRGNAGRLSSFFNEWMENNKQSAAKCTSILQLADLVRGTMTENYGYSDVELRAAMIVEAYEAINAK